MPLSYLRRPLVLVLASYILFLALLHAWGYFRIAPAVEWDRLMRRRSLRLDGVLLSGFSPKRQGDRVRLRIERVWDRPAPSVEDAFVYLPRESVAAELRPGQRVSIDGHTRRPRWPRVPGDFDEQGFCSDKGIAFIVEARHVRLVDSQTAWRLRLHVWAEAAHRSIHEMLARRLPHAEAALWEGLMLGYVGPLPNGLRRDIQDAGVMHLLVPSGAKMAFVLAACLWGATRLGIGPWLEAAFCAAIGGLYALAVGAEPPYLRAYGCGLIALFARPLERDLSGFQAVALSALLVLARSPRELFSAGFQMTYAAMMGILLALPSWRVPARCPRLLHAPIRLAMMSLVVQLSLWPLLARVFGRVSLIGLIANAVLVPLDGALMAVGFFTWFLELAGAPVASALLTPLGRVFAYVCRLFAALPGAAWDARPFGWAGEMAFYGAVLGLFALPRWQTAGLIWSAALASAGFAYWAVPSRPCGALFIERGDRGAIVALLPRDHALLVASTLRDGELQRALFAVGVDRWKTANKPAVPFQGVHGRVEFGGRQSRFWGLQRQFCILHPTFSLPKIGTTLRTCEKVSTRRDGAVWVRFDDNGSTLETQRELYSIGRSVL